MTRFQKAKDRLAALPRDYTYDEAKNLLARLGFEEDNKGKTSGSRVMFFRPRDKKIVLLHKPHPGSIMKGYAVKQLYQTLNEMGELDE